MTDFVLQHTLNQSSLVGVQIPQGFLDSEPAPSVGPVFSFFKRLSRGEFSAKGEETCDKPLSSTDQDVYEKWNSTLPYEGKLVPTRTPLIGDSMPVV